MVPIFPLLVFQLSASWDADKEKLLYSKTFKPGHECQQFQLQIIEHENESSVTITRLSNFKIQHVISIDLKSFRPYILPEDIVNFDDFNFDGYLDFSILVDKGATGNSSYNFYLFNPQRQIFEQPKHWPYLCSPEFHPEQKRIISRGNGGAAGMVFGQSEYLVIGSRLILDRKIEQIEHPTIKGKFLKRVWEKRHGKMKLIQTSIER